MWSGVGVPTRIGEGHREAGAIMGHVWVSNVRGGASMQRFWS